MIYEPFTVVIVPFPFIDSSKAKNRPALVISDKKYQRYNNVVTVAMITSVKPDMWHGDYQVTDPSSAGLKNKSFIRQKIFTIDKRLVKKPIGKLANKDKKAIIKIIRDHISL